MKEGDEQYSKQEAAKRLKAALRGAREVGPKPLKSVPRKATAKKVAPVKKTEAKTHKL